MFCDLDPEYQDHVIMRSFFLQKFRILGVDQQLMEISFLAGVNHVIVISGLTQSSTLAEEGMWEDEKDDRGGFSSGISIIGMYCASR